MRLELGIVIAIGACTGSNQRVLTPMGSPDGGPDTTGGARTWTVETSGTMTDLYGVSGTSPTDVTAVGGTPGMTSNSGVIVHRDSTGWTASAQLVNLLAISGNTAVGEYGMEASEVYHHTSWSGREILVGAATAHGVWQAPVGTYAVGDNGVLFYTTESGIAGSWGTLPSPTNHALFGVFGVSTSLPDDVYVVGASGLILHSTNGGPGMTPMWTATTVGSSTLTGVWGSSANDIYVVGTAPAVILHSTDGGTTWKSTTPPGSPLGLYAIAGRSANDVYAVGATGGVALHSTGNDVWTEETLPTTKDLFGVWVASTGDAFAVGRGGTIVHAGP